MDNIIETKSFDFAVRIVNLYKYLKDKRTEDALSKQLLRSVAQALVQMLQKQNKHKASLTLFQK